MLTLVTYRHAAQRSYYLLVPNALRGWFLANSKGGEAWEVKPVDGLTVPDRGTMVREYYRNALPVPAQAAITAHFEGELWTVKQPVSMREQPPTASLCLFNSGNGTHESYPYVSSAQAIEDARSFTRDVPALRAQVLSRTVKAGGFDGGSTRVWTISGGVCAGSYDLEDAGGVFGMKEDKAAKRRPKTSGNA